MRDGKIPVLTIEADTLPEVWEKAVISTWRQGIDIMTEYDKPEDSPSRDCTMIMLINNPMAEPRIHRAFPGSLEDLEIYRQEVIKGIHDHWIKPEEGKWCYTYYQRLFGYKIEGKDVDQINYVVSKLSQVPHSRRAQAITWNPKTDPQMEDPPCLQRLWFRLVEAGGGELILNMNSHWRSRDAFKAAFMNIFAFTDLASVIAGRISEATRRTVRVGRYVDISDSFHIYGSYKDEFEKFLKSVERRSFSERTWSSKFAESFFEQGRKRIAQEAKQNTRG